MPSVIQNLLIVNCYLFIEIKSSNQNWLTRILSIICIQCRVFQRTSQCCRDFQTAPTQDNMPAHPMSIEIVNKIYIIRKLNKTKHSPKYKRLQALARTKSNQAIQNMKWFVTFCYLYNNNSRVLLIQLNYSNVFNLSLYLIKPDASNQQN